MPWTMPCLPDGRERRGSFGEKETVFAEFSCKFARFADGEREAGRPWFMTENG